MAPRARTEEQILAGIKVTAVDAPEVRRQPRPSGPRVPEMPAIASLVDEVWDSYTHDGSWKIMSVPPSFTDRMRQELQAARRYLEFQHRNDEEVLDIRGLTRPEIKIVDPEDANLPPELVKYKKHIRKDEVGVLWRARAPEVRGIRAAKLAQEGVVTRQSSRAAYKREWRARRKAAEANGSSRVMDPFKN